MNTNNNFEARFETFLAGCKDIYNSYMDVRFPNNPREELVAKKGKRYIKIIKESSYSRSVWAFVDTTNGDVLKAAGWSSPAKGARGNIFDDNNGLARISAYGPGYNN